MSSYLVLFDPGTTDFRLSREQIRTSLVATFPNVRVTASAGSGPRDVVWEDVDGFEGSAHQDGTCIYLAGSPEAAAPFVIWFRSLVREDVELSLCDEGYTFHAIVPIGATVDGAMQLLN